MSQLAKTYDLHLNSWGESLNHEVLKLVKAGLSRKKAWIADESLHVCDFRHTFSTASKRHGSASTRNQDAAQYCTGRRQWENDLTPEFGLRSKS